MGLIKRSVPALAAVAGALLLTSPASAASILTIDTFEVGPYTITDLHGGSPTFGEQSGLSTSEVLGGIRLVRVAAVGAGPVGSAAASLSLSGGDDGSDMTTTGANVLGNYRYIYDGIADGVNNGQAGALNVNLGNKSSTLDFTVSALSLSGVTATLTLHSATTTEISAAVPVSIGANSISLSGFTLDLTDVKTLALDILGADSSDVFSVDLITATVPEPGTAALLALGLVGLAARRARG